MAARRQPAPAPGASRLTATMPIAGGTTAGLKIKLKPTGVAKLAKGSQPPESGEEGPEAADSAANKGGMLKRKRTSPPVSPAPSKRPSREDSPIPLAANGEPVEVVPGKSESLAVDHQVVKQRVGQPHASVAAVVHAEQAVLGGVERESEESKKSTPSIENISHGQLQVNSVTAGGQQGASPSTRKRAGADPLGFAANSPLSDKGVASTSQTSLAAPNTRLPEPTQVLHTIPSHAGWFAWTKIHTLERRGLPEFFNGKSKTKTPEIYLEYRNAILRKYRDDPQQLLTIADMQGQLSGEEKGVQRIIEFLDHWGLINYQVPADWLPVWKGRSPSVEEDVSGMLRAVPQTGASLYQFDAPRAPVPRHSTVNPQSIDNIISEVLAEPDGSSVEYHCNSCSADCSKQRYHCQKQADFDLCPDCYNDGKFGPDMVSTDFMRMDAFTEAANANGGGWTDQETLLLLEALEIYGDNWNEIAEHVATKSKSQCILHFIRLPVEDPFLEEMETPGTALTAPSSPSKTTTASLLQGEHKVESSLDKSSVTDKGKELSGKVAAEATNGVSASHSPVPFADAGNPVMAQVAFLAAMVGPRVAAAAAQAALAVLSDKDPAPRLAAGTAITLDGPQVEANSQSGPSPDRVVQSNAELQSGVEGPKLGSGESASAGMTLPASDTDAASKKDVEVTGGEGNSGKDGAQRLQEDRSLTDAEDPLGSTRVKQAAAAALAAAAVKAKLLADQEEREMQRLVTTVIEHQFKKLELKLKTCNDLEMMLAKECEQVERARQKVYAEHARMAASRLGTASSSALPGQAPVAAPRPAVFTFGPGGVATPVSASLPGIGRGSTGASSSTSMPMPSPASQLTSSQGLPRSGTPTLPQGFSRSVIGGGISGIAPQ